MSELDVREVKLQIRYPESRQEDITDAYMRGYKSAVQVTDKLIAQLNEENEKLREYLAVSIPLPLDRNCSAIHPDDIIGKNIGGTDFFERVTEMYLTRYPRDGQPALWVVRTEDGDGNVSPHVCWGGRCNVIHKQASQTYSAEYLETYDENKQLKAENAKLRERAVAMLSELRGVVSEGDYDSPSGRYFLLRRDVAAYEDALRELGIEVPS